VWVILACSPAVRDFAEARADAICRWHERCDTLEVAGYADYSECSAALREGVANAYRRGELQCAEFDEGQADRCLAVWSSTPCGTEVDLTPCESVCAAS
jgi:hypothetical protein